jgi:DNA polymerase-3 subunit alpha
VTVTGEAMGFVHLHVHSQYSLLDGTMDPTDLAAAASRLGFGAVALTDTANLFGAVAFFKACKDKKISPILGAVLHVQPEGLAYEDPEKERGGYHLVALVEDDVGYQNLCALVTEGIFSGLYYKPRIDLDQLRKRAEGLVFLTGGRRGAFAKAIDGDFAAALAGIEALSFLGPEQLYLELQDLGLPGDEACNDAARRIAAITGRKTVVTNAVHYETDEQSATHELLNAIAMGCSMAYAGRVQSPTDQAYLKSEAEMREIFPHDLEALERTVEIAARCHYKFTFGTYHFPAATPPDTAEGTDTDANWAYFYRAFPPPRDYGLPSPTVAIPPRPPGAGNIDGYFAWYGERGLDLRLELVPAEKHAAYRERLALELRIIAKMGFPAYLLIVAEFINWSKDHGIPVGPGRGSAAGSLVAWAMRITDIDPIAFDLLFERFLNPERVSMPDIDVDFCQDRREEAIQHVRSKYGEELVSQIITYGKLKAKAAVRDVARVLDLSFTDADGIAKLIPDELEATLGAALEPGSGVDQLIKMHDGDPKVRRVLSLARAVEGKARQTGVHAAGVVIADRPLVTYAPLYRDEVGAIPAVQFDMKSAESIGLIKFDFLGLKTLDQIRDTVVAIERNHGVKVDIGRIPVDDAAAFTMLSAGDALGIFQFESSGMRELLSKARPSCLDDLVALGALYRPGPLSSGMVDQFVNRKHGAEVTYPLPMLEPILRPTYGTIVYQEQVMQCAQVMAGYSLGEADLLRRAMGKKDAKEMAKQKSRFVGGSVANGISEQKASEIFDLLEKFAAYGFNKSHSAAYGYISYQTAWLKANYRPEYMAALLTIDAGNTDKLIAYFDDCRAAGIRIDPVSINASIRAFDAPKRANADKVPSIRFGMAGVKGVGEGAIEAIVEARNKAPGKAFRDAYDFFDKIDHRKVNKKVVESLIKAGAFDDHKVSRAALIAGLESAVCLAQRRQEDELAGQTSLFGAVSATRAPTLKWPDVPEWPLSERLANEKEVLGFYISGHPMQSHTKDVARFATGNVASLRQAKGSNHGEGEVRIIGIPADIRVVKTRRGDRMAFVKVEDDTGSVEVVFFPESWGRSQRAVQAQKPIIVTGNVELSNDEVKMKANGAELLSELRIRTTKEVRFALQTRELDGERLEAFIAVLKRLRGNCRTRLSLKNAGRFEVEVDLPAYPVEPGTELDEAVQMLFGRPDAVVLS